MASMNQGLLMSSPSSDLWWSAFLDMHGRDSEEEKAFVGYLSQHGIPAGSGADVLAAAYAEFLAFVQASYEATGEPDPEPKVLEARAEAVKQETRVPRSSMSVAEREKPQDAATRPPALRKEDGAPSPLTDPRVVSNAVTPATPSDAGAPTQAQEEARHRQATEAEASRHAQEEESRQRGRRS